MSHRRQFLKKSLFLSASGLFLHSYLHAAPTPQDKANKQAELVPPPDLFDAQTLDMDFWLKPRTLNLIRPASGERLQLLYWQDGEIRDAVYQECCHFLRDVNGKKSMPIDPKLLETLWATQAFIERFGMTKPLEVLSAYRTPESNQRLREEGIPAARKSLHLEGRAADIRIAHLHEAVLGELIRSFRQGGVGFYFRASAKGGWIHTDTGLQRTWKA